MTDEQLAEIQDRVREAWDMPGGFDVLYGAAEVVVREDLPAVLAKVERLMANRVNTSESMSDARLQEITRRWGQHRCGKVTAVYGQSERFREWLDNAAADEHALLDEVHRLRALLAEARKTKKDGGQ